MTTNKELQDWLSQWPDDATVRVIEASDGQTWGGCDVQFVDVDLNPYSGNVDVTDLRDDPSDPYESGRKVYIELGFK